VSWHLLVASQHGYVLSSWWLKSLSLLCSVAAVVAQGGGMPFQRVVEGGG